jgi:hypothetical protein
MTDRESRLKFVNRDRWPQLQLFTYRSWNVSKVVARFCRPTFHFMKHEMAVTSLMALCMRLCFSLSGM